MKTLTTLTAVAALVAGISIAQAQNAAGPAPKGASPSNLNAGSTTTGQSGSESKRAAMSKSSSKAKKTVTGTSAFCISGAPGGTNSLNCKYKTMASCEKAAKASGRSCAPNPHKSTTGMKSGMKKSSGMKK
jgi:hypothetical protein